MKKQNMKIRKGILVIGIIVAVTLLVMLIGNWTRANMIKEKKEMEKYQDWLAKNCECLKKEKYSCIKGSEIIGSYCVNKTRKDYSPRLKGCSEYNCSGEIKIWNNETEKWEDK